MRIVHDPDRCASTGFCEAIAPEVFEVGPDGELRVLDQAAVDERVRQAVVQCPTAALRLTE